MSVGQALNGGGQPALVGLVRGIIAAAAAVGLAIGLGYIGLDPAQLEPIRIGLACFAVRAVEGLIDQARS